MFSSSSAMFLFGLSLVVWANGNAVNFIEPCAVDDNVCVLKSTIKALPYIAKGIPELNIPASDPMKIDHLTGEAGELELAFRELEVIGLSKCTVIKMERVDRLNAVLVIECPISATGLYEVGGKFLHIDIFGKGDFKFDAENLRFEVDIAMKIITGKDGKEYYKIIKHSSKFEALGEVQFTLDNLYNGDRKKAEPIENIVKETGKELLNTLGQNFISEIIEREVKVVDSFFTAMPINEIELA